jgi:hypothetical protein
MVLIEDKLMHAERLMGQRASYEEVLATIEESERLPGAASVQAWIHGTRLVAMQVYGRSEAEIERELVRYIEAADATPESVPLWSRCLKITAACADSARLTATYISGVITDLEAAVTRANGEQRAWLMRIMAGARQVCRRHGLDAG